jgi:hypothetical protein
VAGTTSQAAGMSIGSWLVLLALIGVVLDGVFEFSMDAVNLIAVLGMLGAVLIILEILFI